MGLYESFSANHGQILLMDPLPSINRVFSLVAQNKKQMPSRLINNIYHQWLLQQNLRTIYLLTTINSQTKRFNNRGRPFCTHCIFQVHTVEKSYKLHGYPLGYKPKSRYNQINAVTNDNISVDPSINEDLRNMFRGFSQSQCQQVMYTLSNHMISVNPSKNTSTCKCYYLTIKNGL